MSPLDLGFLDRVVNVHWGGGAVFVIGTETNTVYYIKLTNKDKDKPLNFEEIELPAIPDVNSYGATFGNSYALAGANPATGYRGKPTFTLCGYARRDFVNNIAVIYTSNDGRSWRISYTSASELYDGTFEIEFSNLALVWHPSSKKFVCYEFKDLPSPEQDIQIWLGSSTGETWAPIFTGPVIDSESYHSAYPDTYCTHNDCIDGRGHHVPDGIMHYEENKLLMRPKSPPEVLYNLYNPLGVLYGPTERVKPPSNQIEIKTYSDDGDVVATTTVTIPGMQYVTCVAGVNSIWLTGGIATGVNTIAASFDSGKTWKSVENSPAHLITNISAAPAADIPAEPVAP